MLQLVLLAWVVTDIQSNNIVSLVRDQPAVITAEQPAVLSSTDNDSVGLAAAAAGKVDVLVTGDKDLLNIAGKLEAPIITPRSFWEQLKN